MFPDCFGMVCYNLDNICDIQTLCQVRWDPDVIENLIRLINTIKKLKAAHKR